VVGHCKTWSGTEVFARDVFSMAGKKYCMSIEYTVFT
jgi:hypothetical protein